MLLKHRFSKEIKEQIKTLYVYDNHHAPFALLQNLFWISLAIYLGESSPWLLPLALLLIGSRQRALATLLHEAAHGALCRSRRLEKFIGTWCSGYLIFQGWSSYKRSHTLDHHHKLGDPDRDPDYQYYRQSGVFETRSTLRFALAHLIKPMLFISAPGSLKYLLVNRLIRSPGKRELFSVLVCHSLLALLLTFLFGAKGYLLYWLLPYLTTFQALTWFIELAEHYPMIAKAKVDLQATRNRFSHPIEHFFTAMHGENFHLIHHLFPAIPYWKLKRAHRILLGDPAYAAVNAGFGGIFVSSNFAPSMWTDILSNDKPEAGNVINAI
ncbi:fatty acid desaturase family protein [Pseudomonas capsici]|uniref:guanitoxin biosynthesis L-arginine gamma (S) hydroxylase n=1 Tax=Pseudomonas capsici TaxID=2810614 RepID=UPI000EFE7E6C|nr:MULTISPECIES: guanitoxin biosynthesis L-arginine gamma (S) hydroxylase [Pseudomonas]MBX8605645.1 fatty acid desaturase family protein [Pseudomonas cichorii]MCV4261595.1 fatty acid desaturase family protein [Pseudomonas capsici]MCV4271711.1 fatty acid desaturase family protein [Pseudomonas capsici]MCV4289447.1 fatty acid desaturase family protein [Pseudomonas capsici]RMO14264.1 Fatty acid desaturase protein [Pseudomonas cichorii]